MASTTHEPTLLYSINNISAYYLQNGEENELNPSGPQTLSLLMVPTSSTTPSPNPSSTEKREVPEDDFYLHLNLPPELDMPLPATTQIFPQAPNSYLIPRWDLAAESGAFIRIQFPSIGTGPGQVRQEDVDTFESILAQCTAFMEHAGRRPSDHARYNPAEYGRGEGYVSSGAEAEAEPGAEPGQSNGKIVLVDEEDGRVMGELTEGYDVVEDPNVKPGSKNPVEIQLPEEGEDNRINVGAVSEEYLRMARHPAYKDSSLVQSSAQASRLVVTGSSYLSNAMSSGAESFTRKTKPNSKPMTFSQTTQSRIRKINDYSHGAANLTAKTAGQMTKYAQNFGASITRGKDTDNAKSRGYDKEGNPAYGKPGVLNRSLIAFSTLTDGLEQGARNVLQSGSAAATTMVNHRYGEEAGTVARDFSSGFRNAGLVYIDATGVSRKAFLKSVAKGMVVGHMRDGQNVVVGGGDGGVVPGDEREAGMPSRSSSDRTGRTPPPAYEAPQGTVSLGGGGGPSMSGGKR